MTTSATAACDPLDVVSSIDYNDGKRVSCQRQEAKVLECPLGDLWSKGRLLLGNYEDMKDSGVLRPYEARIYILDK